MFSRSVVSSCLLPLAAGCFMLSFASAPAAAQQSSSNQASNSQNAEADVPSAPVVVDGTTLFTVRGVSAYPADKRAQQISNRIQAVAKDRGFATQNLRVAETEWGSQILAGDQPILTVLDADTRLEGIHRQVLAQAYMARIKDTIEAFRHDRQPRVLIRHAIYAFAAAMALLLGLFVGLRLIRRVRSALEQRYRNRIQGVGIQAFQIVHARHIWNALMGALTLVAVVLVSVAAYVALYYILSLFPWTRSLSHNLFGMFLGPLRTIVGSFVATIPDLIFLVILATITYYALKLIRLMFNALESGAITMSGFEPEWAKPTYRLTRAFVIAFALVVAFPYIPGSNTQAFKGLSLFAGLIISLGSTSLIGNLISGYTLTYRRVFKQGDRVKIGDHVGYVQESKLMMTYLRTTKNEVIAVPNSQIMNTEVINYSSLAKTAGLILHTTVGIGYETPWRQVEAMLLDSAARTPGLLCEPSPFVRQKDLGDFAVTYEINAYCDNPQAIEILYTALHQNILDVFNEYGVQIMTPAYEGDPEQAKVVAKDKWFTAPARPDAARNAHAALGASKAG
jgi:small-conductance mechanosensitive channel